LCGKAGERIQMSSGTVAMRLIVMELGRFMGLVERVRGADTSNFATGARQGTRKARKA
jgi:hypothetical protein